MVAVAVNPTVVILAACVDSAFGAAVALAWMFLPPVAAVRYARSHAPRRWRQARTRSWAA